MTSEEKKQKINELRNNLKGLIDEMLADDSHIISLTHEIASLHLDYKPSQGLDVDPYDDPKHIPYLNATHQELAMALIDIAKDELLLTQ
jgi:hypothetical protein